ncbi:MAG: hypothetical protein R6X02_24025 [Enhygromyxa sp.]
MTATSAAARALCTAAGLALLGLALRASASPIEPCRPTVVCTVEVEGLPAVLQASGGYQLIVSGQSPVPLPSSGVAHVALHEPSLVRLDGAAYQGSVSINPAECEGDTVHVIEAAPRPARLSFQAGAVPLSELIVSCLSGCRHRSRPADSFPELPFSREKTERVVELEFKARGYRSQIDEFRLTPGDNPIRVSLQRIED